MICLETDRLILRDYKESDFDAYFRLKTDDKTMYYLHDIKLFSIDDAKVEFEDVLADMQKSDRQFYFLHMELKDTHEQVGSIGYTVLDDTPVGKIVHLGYFTYPKFWGNNGAYRTGEDEKGSKRKSKKYISSGAWSWNPCSKADSEKIWHESDIFICGRQVFQERDSFLTRWK